MALPHLRPVTQVSDEGCHNGVLVKVHWKQELSQFCLRDDDPESMKTSHFITHSWEILQRSRYCKRLHSYQVRLRMSYNWNSTTDAPWISTALIVNVKLCTWPLTSQCRHWQPLADRRPGTQKLARPLSRHVSFTALVR